MFRRLGAAHRGRRSRKFRGSAAVLVGAALTALSLAPTSAATVASEPVAAADTGKSPAAAAEQVLTWTANNSITQYASFPTTATAGPATIVFENSVATGNTSGMTHTLTFDTTDPSHNQDVDVDIVASPFDSNGGRHEVQVTLSPGTYRYFCAIPGHGSMTGVLTVTEGGEDTTPPEVSAEVTGDQDADGNYVGSATVTINAQDAGSGVDTVEYEIDDTGFQPYTEPVVVDVPGDHAVQYRATDNAGNTSEVGSVPFTVVEPVPDDTTPPEVSAEVTGEQDADGNFVGSATVTVSAQDVESGVASVEYDLDGAGFTAYTGPFVVDTVGEHTVRYRATDNSGNTSEAGSVSFTVVEPVPDDTTPPVVSAEVTGDQDADGNYVGSATVTITAHDESGVHMIEYNLDGAGFVGYTAPIVVEEFGEHTVSYRATDHVGNTSAVESVSFTVVEPVPDDTTPPEVSAEVTGEQDADGNFVGSATVTVSAQDPGSGVASVSYALDGGSFGPYSGPVTVDEPGEHTVQYRATDNAGNTSGVGSVSFTVVEPVPDDTTPPDVSAEVTGDQDADGNFVGSATVTVSAQDPGSGVASVEYDLDGAGFTAYTGPVTVDEPGEHTVQYRATDNSGNTSESSSVTFIVVDAGPDPCWDIRDTVWIGDTDTGVPNRGVGGGCTVNDLIDDEGSWDNHGAFVRHVSDVANKLVADDVISGREKSVLTRAAANSDIGGKGNTGYEAIFDGTAESLRGWRQAPGGRFELQPDGTLIARGGLGMLWYAAEEFGDFSVRLQFRDVAAEGHRANSGVFVRFPDPRVPVGERPECGREGAAADSEAWVAIFCGQEVQIYDGESGEPQKTGSIYNFDPVGLDGAGVTPKGEWNDYEVRVVGQHYTIIRNGVVINEFDNSPGQESSRPGDPPTDLRQFARGFIGLQNHSDSDAIEFRNVRVREL